MTADEERALEMLKSVERSHLSKSEVEEQTRDINLMASGSKLTIVGPKPEPPSPIPDKEGFDYASMIGKTFVRKQPGIYIGAKYSVIEMQGNQFLVKRIEPSGTEFQFTLRAAEFERLMELPKEKEIPKPKEKEPTKPASPWAEPENKKK